jgi:hypothetical protein
MGWNAGHLDRERRCTMRTGLLAAVVGGAGLVALVQSGEAASCGAGYEPVKIQGNWVCRIRTPKLPLKAQTQRKPAGYLKYDPRLKRE